MYYARLRFLIYKLTRRETHMVSPSEALSAETRFFRITSSLTRKKQISKYPSRSPVFLLELFCGPLQHGNGISNASSLPIQSDFASCLRFADCPTSKTPCLRHFRITRHPLWAVLHATGSLDGCSDQSTAVLILARGWSMQIALHQDHPGPSRISKAPSSRLHTHTLWQEHPSLPNRKNSLDMSGLFSCPLTSLRSTFLFADPSPIRLQTWPMTGGKD
jgi:hypothetical protein